MPNLFGGTPGRVIAVSSNADFYTPLGLIVGDFKSALGIKGLLTGIAIGGQSGFQIMHTLRQYLYVYTFGERAGEIQISGLCFVSDCSPFENGTRPGLARLFDWYERTRISTTGAPILVTVCPGLVLQAFLTKFRYQMEDPSISLGQFVLDLFYPPRVRVPGLPSPFPPPSQNGTVPVNGTPSGIINIGIDPTPISNIKQGASGT